MRSIPYLFLTVEANKVCSSLELPVSVHTNTTGSLPIWKYFLQEDTCEKRYYKLREGHNSLNKILLTPEVRRNLCGPLDKRWEGP